MKRTWKSLLLACNWILLSIGTSILMVLMHPIAPTPAEAPPVLSIIATPVATEQRPQPTPSAATTEPTLSAAEITRQLRLIQADRLYVAGEVEEAQKIYRQVKQPFAQHNFPAERKVAIADPAQLSPAGQVYWRESQAGFASNLQTRILVPLQLLVAKYPEFIPGHIQLAQALKKYDRTKEALDVLERASSLYPNEAGLVKARISALAEAKKWMEASLAARQFAILNSQDPQAPEFAKLADENLNRYKSYIQEEIRGNAIANIITGALGYAFTGSLLGPVSALDSTLLLLQGEAAIGESVAKQAKKQLKVIDDEAVVSYINGIGQKLAQVAGRGEFKYEFFVLPDPELNAFALPGGKIFINAGAIAKTNSEAEIAGLIGHELSHVVLSHGFQLVTQGNLISNVTQYLPLGGTLGQILTFNYSREMERQADTLGTRLIVASGYAADGLRNLMVTLEKLQKNAPPSWLSSHPGGNERVNYLEDLIGRSNYNRYTYEGVERHAAIKNKVQQILQEIKEQAEKKQRSE
jgi:predicted Zn-dependent protease